MITASHLPFNRNGLKFFTKDGGLEKADITEILETAAEKNTAVSETISAESFDLISAYSSRMMDIIKEEVHADDYDHPLLGLHIVQGTARPASSPPAYLNRWELISAAVSIWIRTEISRTMFRILKMRPRWPPSRTQSSPPGLTSV